MQSLIIFAISFLGISIIFFDYKKPTIEIKKIEKKQNVLDIISHIDGTKKINYVKRTTDRTRHILESTGQSEKIKYIKIMSFISAGAGFMVGIIIANILIGLVLACGCYFIPYWLSDFYLYSYEQTINEQLEEALNLVTKTYERKGEIISAIDINLVNIKMPVRNSFIHIKNSVENGISVETALIRSKETLNNNKLFNKWIDTVILCQQNRTMIGALQPIIREFSILKRQQLENKSLMFRPLTDTIQMCSLCVAMFPIIYIVSPDWISALFNNFIGNIIVTAMIIVIFFTINKAIKLSRPFDLEE